MRAFVQKQSDIFTVDSVGPSAWRVGLTAKGWGYAGRTQPPAAPATDSVPWCPLEDDDDEDDDEL